MTLTHDEVEHIANLARLQPTEQEKERYREQLSAILEYFSQLQALDTSDIPPTASVLPVRNVLREDLARPGLSRDEFLRGAPEEEAGQIRVPRVLD